MYRSIQRKAPEKLISFHSGRITGLACSPVTHQAATIAENGKVPCEACVMRRVHTHTVSVVYTCTAHDGLSVVVTVCLGLCIHTLYALMWPKYM